MPTPNEADKVLEMRIRSMAYASEIQNAIAEYREEIETTIRTKHREYEKSVDRRWDETVAKYDAEIANLRAQLVTPAPQGERSCEWSQDDDGCWNTSCGLAWWLETATPAENGMAYCPKCGKPLVTNNPATGKGE